MLEINKIYNMDCLEGMKQMEDNSVNLIVTDPPYEINYNEKSKHLEKLGKHRDKQIERDKTFVDVIVDYDALALEWFRLLKDNSHCYIFCGDKQIVKWSLALTKVGFKEPQILVWKKDITTFDMTMGHKFPENKEFILFFHKGWKKLNGYSIERKEFRSCLNFKSEGKTALHSCAKPERLISFLINLSSKPGDVVLDSFIGSGTTPYIAKNMERKYIGFELSEEYYNISLDRLNQNKLQNWFTNR